MKPKDEEESAEFLCVDPLDWVDLLATLLQSDPQLNEDKLEAMTLAEVKTRLERSYQDAEHERTPVMDAERARIHIHHMTRLRFQKGKPASPHN